MSAPELPRYVQVTCSESEAHAICGALLMAMASLTAVEHIKHGCLIPAVMMQWSARCLAAIDNDRERVDIRELAGRFIEAAPPSVRAAWNDFPWGKGHE